ncbi:ANKS1A, partial [Symbiodinium microadriaticum]
MVANVRLGLALLILAFFLSLPVLYRAHALKVEAASALLMSAAMDQLCRHGIPEWVATWRLYWRVQLLLLMTLKLHPLSLSAAVAFLIWRSFTTMFPEDFLMNQSWREPGLFANESWQRILSLCAYPAAVWCWYLFSFTSKINAIKTGQVVSESGPTSFRERPEQLHFNEGQSSFWRWWTRSTHESVTDSPLSSRNVPAAIFCCIILWGSHLVYVDAAL